MPTAAEYRAIAAAHRRNSNLTHAAQAERKARQIEEQENES